jgi:hypothetical protein
MLLRISQFTQTHQYLVKVALVWLAAAQQPLLVEELIEACTVRLERGGQIYEGLRLSPADIVLLLRHLVTVEKAETPTALTSTVVSAKDYLVFVHSSVREYLTTAQYITPTLRQGFAIDLEQARFLVASSCIAYLLRTNTQDRRQNEHPLREYAWDHWAMYAVASKMYTATETSKHAQDLYEKVAFGSGHEYIPEDLQRIISWTDSKRAVLDCLRNPYFFEEYDASELEPRINEFRLLHIIPSQNPFGVVRLKTMHSPPDATQEYEAVFFHFASIFTKHIWLNGHRRTVDPRQEAALRAMQESSSHNRPFWSDVIRIERFPVPRERSSLLRDDDLALKSSVLTSARSIIVHLQDASQDQDWALDIIRLTDQVLKYRSDDTFNDLAKLLRSRLSTDPFACLASLFQRSGWLSFPNLLEAISGSGRLTFRYGIHSHPLPFERLQSFVSPASRALQLIADASPDARYDPAGLTDTQGWNDVLGMVQTRGQLQGSLSTQPRNVIQLLYASRHSWPWSSISRFCSIGILMPPGAPSRCDFTDEKLACVVFCSYALLLMNNLDLFTVFNSRPRLADSIPSWAGDCRGEDSQPLLYQELITGADGPFCAGGREFREAPAIHRREQILCLKGFQIDYFNAFLGILGVPLISWDDLDRLDRKGYGKFVRGRQWYRTAGGLTVLGPQGAPSGAVLTILIGGKTPYLLEPVSKTVDHFRLIGEWYVNSQSFRGQKYRALTSLATWKA